MMLLQEEQYVISWLSQYGALPKTQLIRMIQKPESTASRILSNLRKRMMITSLNGGYYFSIDPLGKPDPKMTQAVWVLLEFIKEIEPLAHYPANFPSQIFFLREKMGYEIVVICEGDESLTRLLRPEEDLKYIFVVPDIAMAKRLYLPDAPCIFATVDFNGDEAPQITFYSEEKKNE